MLNLECRFHLQEPEPATCVHDDPDNLLSHPHCTECGKRYQKQSPNIIFVGCLTETEEDIMKRDNSHKAGSSQVLKDNTLKLKMLDEGPIEAQWYLSVLAM